MTRVLDTNAVLYALGGRLAEPLPAGPYSVSVITALALGMELITNDARLHQIPGLSSRFPVLKGA
jgi:hypothetical protein